MNAAVRKNESPLTGTHRLLLEEIEAALHTLGSGKKEKRKRLSDKSVHEFRKQLKRARAGLRLLRPYLGKTRYRRENLALRNAAQAFRRLRDAKVLLETLQELMQRIDQPAATEFSAGLRRNLEQRRTDARSSLAVPAMNRSIRTLRASRGRLQGWIPQSSDPAFIGKGLERVYKSGRSCFRTLRRHADDKQWHELRKQVKYLSYELQSLQTLEPKSIGKLAELAHRLGGDLGDDHDLAVMQQFIRQGRPLRQSSGSKAFSKLLRRRRERLQGKSRRRAKRLYSNKPRSLTRVLEKAMVAQARRSGA